MGKCELTEVIVLTLGVRDGTVGELERHADVGSLPLKQVGALLRLVEKHRTFEANVLVVTDKRDDGPTLVFLVAGPFPLLIGECYLSVVVHQLLVGFPCMNK